MGKTLLAKAVAGEAGVNFFSISASQFVEIYVGVGASRVRALYQEAKENVCAVFSSFILALLVIHLVCNRYGYSIALTFLHHRVLNVVIESSSSLLFADGNYIFLMPLPSPISFYHFLFSIISQNKKKISYDTCLLSQLLMFLL